MNNIYKAIIFVVIIGAMVGGLFLVQKSQEVRKGAAANATSSTILPSSVAVTAGNNFSVNLWVNTGAATDKMVGGELVVKYDPAKVKYLGAEEQNGYTILVSGDEDTLKMGVDDGAGNLTFKLVSLAASKSGAFAVAKINFKALRNGTQNLVASEAKILIDGQTAAWNIASYVPSLVTITGGSPAPTDVPGENVVLNYRVSFANVVATSSQCLEDWPLTIKVVANGKEKTYTNVIPLQKNVVDNKLVFSGSLNLVGFNQTNNVSVFISGPKHLLTKYGMNNQVSAYSTEVGTITLSKINSPVYDFSNYPLSAGDVVSAGSSSVNDGIINGSDFAYIKSKSLIHETVNTGGELRGDLDGNCQVNSNDLNILKISLKEKQDQLY